MNTHQSKVVLMTLAGCCLLAATGRAQTTVLYPPLPPATKLEILETNTDRLLIKASGLIGSTSVAGGTVSVTCKEDTDTSTGSKTYGIAIALAPAQPGDFTVRTILDYDELASLLGAVDYLGKMDWSMTSLPNFDATYQTKGGFRITAFGIRSTGAIEYSVRGGGMTKGIVLGPSQLAEFHGLVDQAKRKLDDLRPK